MVLRLLLLMALAPGEGLVSRHFADETIAVGRRVCAACQLAGESFVLRAPAEAAAWRRVRGGLHNQLAEAMRREDAVAQALRAASGR